MWKDAHSGLPPLHPRRRSTYSPSSCWSAPRRPTSSSTSSWAWSRRPTWTATRTRTTTTSTNDNIPDGRVAIREGYIRAAYKEADKTLELGPRAARLRADDRLRRLGPRLRAAVVRGQRRQGRSSTPASGRREQLLQLPRSSRRRAAPAARRRRSAGPAAPRRSTSTSPAAIRAGSSRPPSTRQSATRSSTAFQNLTDPANPGKQVVLKIMKKEELRERRRDRLAASEPQRRRRRRAAAAVPVRCGDAGAADRVLAVLRPARLSAGPGRHRRTTSTCTRRSSPPARGSARRTPVAGRAGDRRRADRRVPARASPGRRTPAARSCSDLVDGGGNLRELPILDISDYHGQLDAARRGRGQRRRRRRAQPDLHDRRRGVPEAVVRRLSGARRRGGRSPSPPATRSVARRRRSRPSSATSRRSRS